MYRLKRRQFGLILIIVVLFLLINVGYALMSQDFSITGYTKMIGGSFDVHFQNESEDENYHGDLSLCRAEINDDGDEFSYEAYLGSEDDECRFRVELNNNGSYGALININDIQSFPYVRTTSYSRTTISAYEEMGGENELSSVSNKSLDPGDNLIFYVTVERTGGCDSSGCEEESDSFSFGFSAEQSASGLFDPND